jgi:hypothetical protein
MATHSLITETATVAAEVAPDLGQLSFTGRRADDSGVDLWAPPPVTGGWIEECRVGRSYGHEAVEYIREANDAAALGGIVQAIIKRGTYGGVEAGFFAAVSMSLTA